jgi:hypothetical protein
MERLASATTTTEIPSLDSTKLGLDNAATRSTMTTLRMDAATTFRVKTCHLEPRNAKNQIGASSTSNINQPGCSNEIHTEDLLL